MFHRTRLISRQGQLTVLTILPVLVMLVSASCSNKVPAYTRRHFGNCYSGDSTGLSSRLNLAGIYRYYELTQRHGETTNTPGLTDSSQHNILLYENGNFLLSFGLLDALTGERAAFSQTANLMVDTVWLRYGLWGIYRLSGDTIIGQWLYPSRGTISSFGGLECRYLILEHNRLQYLDAASRPLDRRTAHETNAFRELQSRRKYTEASFVPLMKVPPVRSWLNQESWLRCK